MAGYLPDFVPVNSIGALATLVVFGACSTVSVEPSSAAINEPETENQMVSESLPSFTQDGISNLEGKMASYVEEGKLYGIATRLVKDGETISDFRAGVRRLESGEPIEDDTIFRIYSMSKPVTGVALLQLWEDGKFQLDDPVSKYVPEFDNLKVLSMDPESGEYQVVDAQRSPTIKELMNHTAGFAYGLGGDDPANSAFRDKRLLASPDLQTFIDGVAAVPLLFQPGDEWAYSASVDIQGYLVEKISGQRFGDYLEEHIFAPLNMVDTGFYVPEADYERFSEVYGYHPETGALVPIPYPQVQFRESTLNMESGGGGLVSTMNDYSNFAQMLLNEGSFGDAEILKPETVQLMSTNTLPDHLSLLSDGTADSDRLRGIGHGLNVGVMVDPELAERKLGKGSFFWGGAAGTWFWVDPENDLFFIGMIQVFDRDNKLGALEINSTSSNLVYSAMAK